MIPFSKRPARGLEASELIKTEDIEAWRKSGPRPTSRDAKSSSLDEDRTRVMPDPKSPGGGVQAVPKGNKKKSEAELEKTDLRGMVTRGRGVDEMTQLRPQGAGQPEARTNTTPSPAMFAPPPKVAPSPQPQVAPPTPGPGFVSPAVLPAVAQAVAPAVAQAVAQAVVQAVGIVQGPRPLMPTAGMTGMNRQPAAAKKPRSIVAWAAPVSLVVSLLALGAVLIVRGEWFQSLVSKDGSRAVRAQEAAATAAPPTPDLQPAPAAPTPASTDPTPITATVPMDTMQPATTPHARHYNSSAGQSRPATATPAPTHTVVAQQATAPTPTTPAPTAATPAAVPPTAADNDAKNLSSAADKELENLIKP